MKQLSILLVLALITILLFGCQKSYSQIIEEDGNYFLILDNLPDTSNTSGYKAVAEVDFESFDELLADIRNGTFTDAELKKISEFPKDDQGRIFLFDLTTVLEPVYAESITDYDVRWYGSYYSFTMQTDDPNTTINLKFVTQEALERKFEAASNLNSEGFDILSVSRDEDRNASVLYYDDGNTVHKQIKYTITNNDATYKIIESYYISGSQPYYKFELDPSESIPSRISMFISKNGKYFTVVIFRPTERPSIEWLTQFDVREYTPE